MQKDSRSGVIGVDRGVPVRCLFTILQDIHQLRAVYGERAGTFLSNAGVLQVFNVADVDTASWVSRTIGATTQAYTTSSTSASLAWHQLAATKSTGTATHLTRRDLLTPTRSCSFRSRRRCSCGQLRPA